MYVYTYRILFVWIKLKQKKQKKTKYAKTKNNIVCFRKMQYVSASHTKAPDLPQRLNETLKPIRRVCISLCPHKAKKKKQFVSLFSSLAYLSIRFVNLIGTAVCFIKYVCHKQLHKQLVISI